MRSASAASSSLRPPASPCSAADRKSGQLLPTGRSSKASTSASSGNWPSVSSVRKRVATASSVRTASSSASSTIFDREEVHDVTDGSDDGFLYARGFILAAGRDFYAVDADLRLAVLDADRKPCATCSRTSTSRSSGPGRRPVLGSAGRPARTQPAGPPTEIADTRKKSAAPPRMAGGRSCSWICGTYSNRRVDRDVAGLVLQVQESGVVRLTTPALSRRARPALSPGLGRCCR